MADLIGTASIRVDSNTAAASQAIRRFSSQADNQLQRVQRRLTAVSRDMRGLRGASVAVGIDDRTAAGVASVRAAVDGLRNLGPVRIPASIDDDTAAGSAAIRATVARMQALGPVQINATVDVDAAATTAAAAALRDLTVAARGAARAVGTLATRATAAAAALALLGTQARTLRGDVDDLDGSLGRAGGGMTGLRGRLGTVTTAASAAGDAMGALSRGAALLAPALIPIAVQAAPIAASLGAATVAIGAFAAAAGGQISAIKEASEAEKTYKDAVAEHGAASQQAGQAQLGYQRTVADMPHPTRVAAAALSGLKEAYDSWSDSLAASTMPVATRSFAALGALFPKLTPVVQGAGTELKRFVTIATGGIASPGFDRFMKSFAEFSTGVLSRGNDALIQFVRTLDTGKVSGGVAQFMEYVRANGPLVRDTLSNLGQTLGNLLEGAANVGPSLLTVVNALAGIVAAVPPGAITVILQLATAMKVAQLAAVGMAAASVRMAAFGVSVTAMRVAAAGASGVLPRLSAAMGTLGTMSSGAKLGLAAAGVGALVLALHELSDNKAPVAVGELSTSLNTLATTGKVTGALKSNFNEMSASIAIMSKGASDNKLLKLTSDFGTWIGIATGPSVSDAAKNLDAWDKSMADAVAGGKPKLAAAQFEILKKAWVAGGGDVDRLKGKLNDYQDALANQKFEQQVAAQAMGIFGDQAQATSAKLDAQRTSADGLRAAITALNDVNRSAHDAQTKFAGSLDGLTKSFAEHGATLNEDTAAGRANRDAMSAAAAAQGELLASGLAAGDSLSSMTGKSEKLRTTMMRLAVDAFDGNKKKAREYTNELLGTPSEVKTLVKAERAEAITGLQAVQAEIRKTPKSKSITVSTLNAAAIKALEAVGYKTKTLKDGRTKVTTANGQAIGSIGAVGRALSNLDGKTARTTVYSDHINTTIYRTKGSLHDVVGATGGLYTGADFKFRGKGYADGGLVNGPGTETSDSVYAPFLSKNEFVVNARRTREHLPLLKAINSGQMGSGQMGMAGGGMAGAGAAVGAGLVSGLNGATRAVEDAARTLAAAVTSGVRDELQIASPSRVMKALAKDVGAGFLKGLTDSRDKIKSVSKDLASDVRAAFSGRRETNLIKMIGRNTDRLLSEAKKRDAVTKKIADAKAFSSDVAGKARATGSLGSIVQDDFFAPSYVEKRMKAALASVKSFSANVSKLQKKGLSKALLRQVLEMGPEAGGAFAKSLAGADAATIKRYNKLQSDLDKQSKSLGNKGADMLYDSGRKAGAGFLTGLKAQQKSIEKLMLSIAKGMQKAIRRALKIKSPSMVMDEVGQMTVLGLRGGIVRRLPLVQAAMGRVAATVKSGAPDRVRTAVSPTASVPQLSVGASRRPAGAGVTTVVYEDHYHVHAENHGAIGSQIEMDNWLMNSVNRMAGQGRFRRLVKTGGVRA